MPPKKPRSAPKRSRAKGRARKPKTALFTKLGTGLRGALQAKNIFKALLLSAIWGFVLIACVIGFYAYELPEIIRKTDLKRHPAVIMEARDGTVFARYGDFHGDTLTVKDVPPQLIQAFLAIEDRRFYQHGGIDLWGVLRASASNLLARHMVQGGSTITQQLAKNLFLGPQRTLRRKIQEALLALWLEHKYTKDEILAAYLNRIYLGSGAFGVDAAARLYFNKSARAVTLREACILAGLPRAPSRYSPLNDPGAAEARARVVMQAMVDAGYLLPNQKAESVTAVPLPTEKPGGAGEGHYFADWIMEQLGDLIAEQDEDVVIRTTLDLSMQREAERQVAAILAAHGEADRVKQAALVSIGRAGAVRALVGGRDYTASSFDRATQAHRQPGSAFKPIVYLAALEKGFSPSSPILDAPINIDGWRPENYSNQYKGEVSLEDALAYSLNTATIRLARETGLGSIRALAKNLGITTPLRRDLSLALGTSEVSLIDMTSVYAVFAQHGRAVLPYGIENIRAKNGKSLYTRTDAAMPRIASESSVDALDGMLQAVVRYGTGKKAAPDGTLSSKTVAGKTGTTQDYRDAWFVGYTGGDKGGMTTGVWLGNDDNSEMRNVTGGSLPAQLWHDYMLATASHNAEAAPAPEAEKAQSYTREQSLGLGKFIGNLFGGKITVEPAPLPGKKH